MKRFIISILVITLLLSGCALNKAEVEIDGTQIKLSDEKITVDGKGITNDNTQAVYTANDIVYYESDKDFTYGEGTKYDEHSKEEADDHTVIHITKAGKYVLSGKLSAGQIAVDLGENAEENPEAVVTLILNGVDITCTVAPAVIFYNVYECGVADEETATKDIDTKNAGANVIIADGTENNVNGSYVARIYKSYELNEEGTEVVDSKKLHKYDGAFYSKKTMNIDGGEKGDGILTINAENEGLDSELHLTINGGNINIYAGNDGINTNEDNVSVATVNGGSLNIVCNGKTGEGDGIDSNGWLVINGGTVTAQACSTSGDSGIDADKGIYLNGGSVVASGNMFDRIAGGESTYAVFSFASRQVGDSIYTLKNADNKIIGEYAPKNDFTYLVVAGENLTEGDYTFWQGDTQLACSAMSNADNGMNQGERPELPENMEGADNLERPERPDFQNGERPEMPNGEAPQMPEGMENMTPPNGFGGMGGNFNMMSGETSTVFTIKQGGNQFANIQPISTTVTE